MEFNLFDIIITSVVGMSVFFGLYKGFIKSIVSLVSIAFLGIITSILFPLLQNLIDLYVQKRIISNLISGLGSFLISLVITSVIYAKFMDFIKDIRGGAIDRFFGICFGAARGLLVAVGIFGLCVISSVEDVMSYKSVQEFTDDIDPDHFPAWISDGLTYKLVFSATKSMIDLIPKGYMEEIMNIEFFKIDKNKDISISLKPKPKPQVLKDDADEYFAE